MQYNLSSESAQCLEKSMHLAPLNSMKALFQSRCIKLTIMDIFVIVKIILITTSCSDHIHSAYIYGVPTAYFGQNLLLVML